MRRVNESVRQVLAETLPELKDPRIGLVTVTGVDTAPDLRHAVVFSGRRRRPRRPRAPYPRPALFFVWLLASFINTRATLGLLAAAHGVLQSSLAKQLRLKRTPQLTFEYDQSVEHGVRMSQLIDELAPRDDADGD